jgi:hypothetical protein
MIPLKMLEEFLFDPKAGWSMGSFGAVAEFHQDEGERAEPDTLGLLVCATRRGAISFDPKIIDHVVPVAYEALSAKPHRWSHGLALCLPSEHAPGAVRNVLTELGSDEDAVRSEDQDSILFDMGLALPQCDFCIRTDDASLIDVLREHAGRSLFDPANPAIGFILKAHPHRVAVTRIGRVEVFQKIGGPDTGGVSPLGPHTHLLPQLLKSGRTHSANTPIPERLLPLGYLRPANPVMDSMGVDVDFDIDAHTRFQSLFDQFARPDLSVLRKTLIETLARGDGPEEFPMPADRFARATVRITLRQQQRLAEKTRAVAYGDLISRWRQAFDKVSDSAETDEDAPGH